MNMFRTLRADEIECRINQIKDNEGKATGLTLLLYKDARCDQNILDETVGAMNWKREHTRDNRNCIVSLWDSEKKQWVSKEDTGTESNTEKEKGLASDSFKRSCVNWGIGRELYTSPFIWIKAEDCKIFKDSRGKWACYDKFSVAAIDYVDRVICYVVIRNNRTGKICYEWGEPGKVDDDKPLEPEKTPDEENPEQSGKAEVRDKLPKETKPNPVGNYLINEITALQGKLKLKTYGDAKKMFNEQVKALVDGGVVPPIDWAIITMEEAKNLVSAVKANFVGDVQ